MGAGRESQSLQAGEKWVFLPSDLMEFLECHCRNGAESGGAGSFGHGYTTSKMEGGTMKLITERTQVQDVAARWAISFPPDGRYGRDAEKLAIAKALAELDTETATAADVAAIIGNDSWCRRPTCHECGMVVDVAVQVGEELDYESSTATICVECLQKALAMATPPAA